MLLFGPVWEEAMDQSSAFPQGEAELLAGENRQTLRNRLLQSTNHAFGDGTNNCPAPFIHV